MERLTISLSDAFASELATFMADHRYDNRSEAVRDLARRGLAEAQAGADVTAGACVATLTYVYDHGKRDLARRLTETHHDHHTLQVATMHVHLDHETCLEVVVLRGEVATVRRFAEGVIAERGVSHGRLELVPVVADTAGHPHTHPGEAEHLHLHPKR